MSLGHSRHLRDLISIETQSMQEARDASSETQGAIKSILEKVDQLSLMSKGQIGVLQDTVEKMMSHIQSQPAQQQHPEKTRTSIHQESSLDATPSYVQDSDVDRKRSELRDSIGRLCTLADKESTNISEIEPLVKDLDNMLDTVLAVARRERCVIGKRQRTLSNDLDSNSTEVSELFSE